jgi:hypothetical protein
VSSADSCAATPAPAVTIIIEGPIESINAAGIVIYNQAILLDATNPILLTMQIGDFARVEGDAGLCANVVTIIAVNVFVESVNLVTSADVIFGDDNTVVWTDNGNCDNPPPPWAPAHGWRRRCEGGTAPGNSGNAGDNGIGMGMGD